MSTKFLWACCFTALFGVGGAQAATTWNFATTTPASTGSSYGNSMAWAVDGVTATATAWSNTADKGATTNVALDTAYLARYSGGLGVENKDCDNGATACKNDAAGSGDANESAQPEHAMDSDQRYDSILFTFTEAVKLTQAAVGWRSNDADIFVLAYTGAGPMSLSGKTYADLTASGWSNAGTQTFTSTDATNQTSKGINGTGFVSSYWLVGTAKSIFGLDSTTDHLKLASLTGEKPPTTKVPEPATALLIGLGLLGFAVQRKRS